MPIARERLQSFLDRWTDDLLKAFDLNRCKAQGKSIAILFVQYSNQRILMWLMLGFQGYFWLFLRMAFSLMFEYACFAKWRKGDR